jgi:hypothetical protein
MVKILLQGLRTIALLTVMTCTTYVSVAQVSNYIFSESVGTYTAITGGNVLVSCNGCGTTYDTNVYGVTLPSSFPYNGATVSAVTMVVDGSLVLGTTTGLNSTAPISSTQTATGIIAGLGMDLRNTTLASQNYELRWEEVGSEFVFQWTNASRWLQQTVERFSFQIRIHKTSGAINIVYGNMTTIASSQTYIPQVGLRGTTNADYNARRLTTTVPDASPNWGAPNGTAAATSNAHTVRFTNTSPAAIPTSGLTFTWTPAACAQQPTALSAPTVNSTSATITWTAASPAPSSGYEIYHSTSATAPTAGTTATATVGAGVTTITLNNLSTPAIAANNTYYVWVRSNCNGTDKSSWVALPSFNTLDGNNCGLVQDLASLTSPFSGTTVGYTNNFTTSNGSCLTGTGGDRIFKIDVPNNYTLFIGQSVNGYDSRHRVAYGGACPGTTEINTGYVANFPTTQTTGVTAGCLDDDDLTHYYFNNTTGSTQTVYWIQDGHTTGEGTFTLEWQLNAPPACLAPTALNASPVTATSAQINWIAPSPAPGNGYEIYHSTSATAPTAGTTPTATVGAGTTNVTLNNLSTPAIAASTLYYVWVRSNCNGTDKSTWVALPSFTTPCASITSIPYSESFDAATDPACWSKALLTGSTNWAPDNSNDGVPAPRTGCTICRKGLDQQC